MDCVRITFPYNPLLLSELTLLRSKLYLLLVGIVFRFLGFTFILDIVYKISAMIGIVQDSK
jgi:hypothetical protein